MAWLIFETINFRPRSPATVLDFGERIVETRNELAASEQSEFQAAANSVRPVLQRRWGRSLDHRRVAGLPSGLDSAVGRRATIRVRWTSVAQLFSPLARWKALFRSYETRVQILLSAARLRRRVMDHIFSGRCEYISRRRVARDLLRSTRVSTHLHHTSLTLRCLALAAAPWKDVD